MKMNIMLSLTVVAMLLSMSILLVPASAKIPTNEAAFQHKFDPNSMPADGTEYVLTISGKAKFVSIAGGLEKHWTNKLRAIDPTNVLTYIGNEPSFGSATQRSPLSVPMNGEVKIKVANFFVLAGEGSSQHPLTRSILANPYATVFVVESGSVRIGDETYAVDSGVALYYNAFTASINTKTGTTINLHGDSLSGGIPGLHSTVNINEPESMIKINGETWRFDGGVAMSRVG